MYQNRERIEPLLLRYNIPLLSEEQIDDLERMALAMEQSTDIETFLALDRDFHLSCCRAAETTVLEETVVRLWNRTQHYRRAYTRLFRSTGDRSVHHEHHLLVSAIRRRDLDEQDGILVHGEDRDDRKQQDHKAAGDDALRPETIIQLAAKPGAKCA